MEFYQKYITINLTDFASVVNLPLADHPYETSMTTSFGGNVIGGHAFKHLNLTQNRLTELALAQLKDGLPVFFGCDVSQESNRAAGLLTLDAYDFKTALDIEFTQSRSSRLLYRDGDISHAMLLVGAAFDAENQPTNWKVENSWGDKNGQNGYFVASQDWMQAHTYQVVVNKKYLTAAQLGLTAQQMLILNFLGDALADNPEPEKSALSPLDLETEFNMARSTTTEILQRMEKAGFISRQQSPTDARQKLILLTDKGRALLPDIKSAMLEHDAAVLDGLAPEEIAAVRKFLHHIAELEN